MTTIIVIINNEARKYSKAKEMAQSAISLPYKHEDLSPDPRTHIKIQVR